MKQWQHQHERNVKEGFTKTRQWARIYLLSRPDYLLSHSPPRSPPAGLAAPSQMNISYCLCSHHLYSGQTTWEMCHNYIMQ